MKLLRIVVMSFGSLPDGWDRLRVERDDVLLLSRSTMPASGCHGVRVLVTAETRLSEMPSIDTEGWVEVPEKERRRLEMLLETTASTVSVCAQTRHSIMSAIPSIALMAEDARERQFLDGCAGFDTVPRAPARIGGVVEMTPKILDGLADRLDGVGLLGAIYASSGALARYRELARFFELAFALPMTSLAKKLYQFLDGMPFGYTQTEVKSWCVLRHGSMHGDHRVTKSLVMEADVAGIVDRMQQAALDVLFNKGTWHDSSRQRRNLWSPPGGTTDGVGGLMIVAGKAPIITFHPYDEFMAYPLDLKGRVRSQPSQWWCPQKHRGDSQPDSQRITGNP